jgi:hypothetical protein
MQGLPILPDYTAPAHSAHLPSPRWNPASRRILAPWLCLSPQGAEDQDQGPLRSADWLPVGLLTPLPLESRLLGGSSLPGSAAG